MTAGVLGWLLIGRGDAPEEGSGKTSRSPVRKVAGTGQVSAKTMLGEEDGSWGIDWSRVPAVPVQLGPFQERLLKDADLLQRRRIEAAKGMPARELRLWRTDFKHPLVREESWLLRDAQGREVVVRREFSVADHVMVRFPEAITADEVRAWAGKKGLKLRQALQTAPVWLVAAQGGATLDTAEGILRAFREDFPTVGQAVAERDFLVFPTLLPNDQSFSDLWGMNNTGKTGGVPDADIDAPEAWDLATGSREVLVGVIDTGIDRLHPDLTANLWSNPREVAGNGVDDDGNGFVDDVHGWDFFANDNDPTDENNHGTHCAGTIGAVGNNLNGVVGVCWQVSLVGIRFLGPNGGTTSDAVESVNYARSLGVNLTSNSWGGGGYSALLQGAIQAAEAAGQLFVAAAGNDGQNTDLLPNYPSGYPLAGIVAVAASTDRDARATFSNFGAASVDLAAPGAGIYSTIRGGGYASFNGTSMATPHVAGAAALLLSVAPGLPPTEVKSRLMSTVDVLPAFSATTAARGRLNLARLIQQSAGPRPLAQVTEIREAAGGGNGDGVLNPGETLDLYLRVTNRGTETAENVNVRIAPVAAASAFTVLRGEQPAGTLQPGAVFTAPMPLQVRSASSAATPLAEELEITLTYGTTLPRTLTQRLSLYLLTSSYVEGRVTDATTGAALPGAVVRLAGPSVVTATTDADGGYRVLATDGAYQATAAAAGLLTSAPVSVTVPPGRTGVNFSLGRPQLSISPPMVQANLYTGRAETRRLELRNQGSAALTWSLRLAGQPPVSGATSLLTMLPERVIAPGREDGDTGPRCFFKDAHQERLPALNAPLGSLTGVTVGLIATAWDRAVLLADLQERGAAIVTLTPPLTASVLAGVDVLLVDDAIRTMSTDDIAQARARVAGGMGLLCEADDAASVATVNQLFQGTGITAAYEGFRDVTFTDIRPHPMTAGIARLVQVSVGASATAAGQAQVLVGAGAGRAHAALARLGQGVMLFAGNEITDEANFVSGDGRRFANQVVEGLAAGPAWLSASPLSGTLPPGLSQVVDLRLDPAQAAVGSQTAYALFETNIPDEGTRVVPVDLHVADAPEMTLSAAELDFGTVIEGQPTTMNLVVRNTGTLDLRVDRVTVTGADASFFQVPLLEPFTLAPGGSREIAVALTVTAPLRLVQADLVLGSNDPLRPIIAVPLRGQRQRAPDGLVSPARISLRMREGETSAAVLSLRNRGRGPLRRQASLTAAAGGSPLWATVPGISGVVNAGATGQVKVLVDASAAGPGEQETTLVLTTNDPDTPVMRVPIQIMVQALPLPRYAPTFEAEELAVGQTGAFQIPVWNDGSAPLLLGPGVVISSAFRITTRFPISIPAGESRMLDFQFVPRAAGRLAGTVLVATNARTGPLFIRLTGQARLGPRLAVAPTTMSLTLAPGAELVRWLRVTNTGDRELDWDVALESETPWLDLEGEAAVLAPRQSTQIALRLRSAELPAGTHTAAVLLTRADTGAVTRVPVRITVRAGAALALTPRQIHLPQAWAGHVEQSAFRCENTGNLPLTLRAIRPSHQRLALLDAAAGLPVVLQPGEGLDVGFTFTTNTLGRYADAFFITTSLDPARPVRLPVTAVVSEAPLLRVMPNRVDLEVPPGEEAGATLSLTNTGGDVLEWTVSPRDGTGPAKDLPAVLAAAQASPTLLTGLLPAAHALTEGVTGSMIADGGAGMFMQGNRISTDLAPGQFLAYADGVVASSATTGVQGSYFTRKSGPLWMLAADLDGASRFTISGGLGAPSTARVTGGSLTRVVAGVSYRGFYKRVVGTPVPSVHHLIILEDRPGLAQVFDAENPGSDFHEVTGLTGRTRVYYLMFGLTSPQSYPETSLSLLMDTFLRQMVHQESADWLLLGQAAGSVTTGQTASLDLLLSPAQLLAGTYSTVLRFATNSPVTAAVDVPVTMRLPARPQITLAPVRFDFPETFVGTSSDLVCTLRNPGNETLLISAIQPSLPAYEVTGATLPMAVPRGGVAVFRLRFRPTAASDLPGELLITSNAYGRAEWRLPITGRGLRGPVMRVLSGDITATLEPGSTSQHGLRVENQGDAPLSWSAAPSASLTALAALSPASGLVLAGTAQEPLLSLITTATTPPGSYAGWMRVSGNDPLTPYQDIPVNLTVNSRPRGELNRADLAFGSTVVGSSATGVVTVSNVGNAPLRVDGCTITDPAFSITGTSFPFTLAVGASRSVSVIFTPTAAATIQGELRFATASPALPNTLVLRVSGQGLLPPVLAAQPLGGIQVALKKGQTLSTAVTVRNEGGSTLLWQASITDRSTPAGLLEDVRLRFNNAHQAILAQIQDPYLFEEGITGTYILDGGSDMYDLGNDLGTNLGSSIPYSDQQVATAPQLGTGGSYFTCKQPGLFLFTADLGPEVNSFNITGNLGADGSGTTSTDVLERSHRGRDYVAYFKSVSDAGDPSVNHLIIVERRPGLSRTYSSNTDRDDHTVHGLSGGRLYYLLFSRQSGLRVSTEMAGQVLDTFLDQVALPPTLDWVTASPTSGYLQPSATAQVQITLQTQPLALGQHSAKLRLQGNAPGAEPLDIPIQLTVEEPDMLTSPAWLELLKVEHPTAASAQLTLTARTGQSSAWTATSSARWLVLSKTSGIGSDVIQIQAGA
ncbi:MAG: S8 family serine peptidase, partial [Prosthecobacter sp.]|nr:S8 family serine peptidase [Prosthecobacter sp.]